MQKILLLKEWQLALLLGGAWYISETLDVLSPTVSAIIYNTSMALVILWYCAVVIVFSPKNSMGYKFWNYLYLLAVIICSVFIWIRELIIPIDWFHDIQTGDLNFETGIFINIVGIIIWLFLVGFACHILLVSEEKYFGKYKSNSLFTFLQFFFLFIGVFFLGKRIKSLLEHENV